MERRTFITAGLVTLGTLAFPPFAFGRKSALAPPPPSGLETLLANTELGHTLFGDHCIEYVPEIRPRSALHAYLTATVPDDTIIFSERGVPYAAWSAPQDGAFKRQYDKASKHAQRKLLIGKAKQLAREYAKEHGVPYASISFNTGYADTTRDALTRYAPYAKHFEALARQWGLDSRTGAIALQETNFTLNAVSRADCEGPFQLSRDAARMHGLIVPKGRRGGNAKFVNESFHPLLAAEAAFRHTRMYAMITGSLHSGISAYHTGPGNITRMRWIVLKGRKPPKQREIDALVSAFHPTPLYRDEVLAFLPRESAAASLAQQARMVNGARHSPDNPRNGRYYGRDSAEYLPRLLALLSQTTLLSGTSYTGERVTLRHADKRPLYASDIARRVLEDDTLFAQYNPHIPLRARIPDGTRLFLPHGMAGTLQRQFPTLRREQVVRYEGGGITPAPTPEPLTDADREYARLVRQRYDGQYHLVTPRQLSELIAEFTVLHETAPSAFRAHQLLTARTDLRMYGEAPKYAELLRASAEGARGDE